MEYLYERKRQLEKEIKRLEKDCFNPNVRQVLKELRARLDHHVVPRSRGGSDTIGNLAGVCFACHDKVHKDEEYEKELKERKSGLNKKYGALSVLNQIIPKLTGQLIEILPDHVYVTNGWNTKTSRYSPYHK